MKKVALIMAGGKGERFWPKSRESLPKQFLSLIENEKTMIQLTVERILPIIDIKDIYIATNAKYKKLVQEQLPKIPEDNILIEPIGRNTAPCIGLGAVYIKKKYEDAVMFIFPSDHMIKKEDIFREQLEKAFSIAKENENFVTIGIEPTYPEVGYGYIKVPEKLGSKSFYKVECFTEKPVLEVAKEYVSNKQYLWNGGIFTAKSSTILNNIKEFIPELYDGLNTIYESIGKAEQTEVLAEVFPKLPNISIDYGVLEKTRDIYVVPSEFEWDDVGNWLAVERLNEKTENGNVIKGKAITINSKNCIIQGESKKLIATIGLKDIAIIDTEDAILICDKYKASDIKNVTEELRKTKRDYLL